MLLGRTALARAFTVDPGRSFLHGRSSRREPGVVSRPAAPGEPRPFPTSHPHRRPS